MYLSSTLLQEKGIDSCDNLMVVAHPDDESLWGGAHLLFDNWFVICLTNGDNKIRSKEFYEVLDYTNNKGIILTYPDLVNGVKSNWSECEGEVREDLSYILNYKDWELIATHNPAGETGHIHHLNTNRYMCSLCEEKDLLNRLYYFGRFYETEKIPRNLPQLSYNDFLKKKEIIALYKNEAAPISYFWAQMIPYENWVLSTDWGENE